ncbi:MAG: family N-acetyltransferase [Cypionkella sp.]|uniref:GNAT family N-acetyltransferase n=1 Tax=Cypionkella sp. TaxID=2811411 RepID=UPI002633362E|nr:GNAT family protein [Cypionkella sp.]MDB5657772.1 family N-acetyltransferase [Cypionkella sp.]
MAENMQHWTPRQRPQALTLEGRFVRLEKLEARHTAELFAASATAEADVRFTWLPEAPPSDLASFGGWVEKVAQSEDPIFFAIIDKASGKVAGRQTLMRIDAVHGVVEIGNIYWGPLMARKPAATEALYLFAQYVFDTLGYRRFEWICNDDNAPSKQAALRFGFQAEGVFRQHMVVKGLNRDTAWFAMIDKDWVKLKPAYEAWLAAENCDADGQQKRRLEDIRAELGA